MQRTIPLFRGLSVMVAAVVVGALWLLGGRPGVTDEEATSLNFYVEAQATVIQRSNVRLSAGIPDRPIVTTLRWWYAAKLDRWRWEIESTGTSLLGSSLIAVFDGRELWQYDGRSDTYTRTTPPPYPDGTIPSPTALSLPFGPSNTATVEEFIALFGRVAEYITVTGNERVLDATPPSSSTARRGERATAADSNARAERAGCGSTPSDSSSCATSPMVETLRSQPRSR